MKNRRVMSGIAAVALVAMGALVAPAFGASEQMARPVRRPAMPALSIAGFTPAAADPRLAAVFARGGLDTSDFRFTPADTRRGGRAVTVAVRARNSSRAFDGTRLAATAAAPTVGLAPVAYNLGAAVGWKRFAVTGDVAHVDLASTPGSRDSADLALSYTASRFSSRVKAAADRPIAGTPQLLTDMPSYSVDLSSSYALTRNLAVTAGVRYRTDRERLAQVTDDRRDSQAVYLGTAFRF
ncbi:hypothetical protein [Sphingomonas sp. GC_Shp_2]|uniref:hypothetical protein n=1 Tax=unclassified Sphingomonas TaxID=196159 RepID=UPI003211F34F